MSYRDRTDIVSQPSQDRSRKSPLWIGVALTVANLGPLLGSALKNYGFHASAEAVKIGDVAIGALCIVGGLIAYREARRSAAQHVAELTGEFGQQHGHRR